MTFPSTIEILDTNILGTQRVSARNHALQHNDVNRIVNVLQTLVMSLTPPSGSTIYNVTCVFDDAGNDLPTTTPGVIDNYTIQHGDLVYVKDCLDAGKINNIYEVVISGASITYTYVATLGAGDILNVQYGDVYGGNTYIYNPTTNTIIIHNYGSKLRAFTTAGTSAIYTITVAGYTAYEDNDVFIIYPHITSSIPCVLNVNGLGAIPIDITDPLENGNFYIIGYKVGQFKVLAGVGGGGGSVTHIYNLGSDKDDQIYNGTDLQWILPTLPLTEDLLHITTDSGTNLILDVDYSILGNVITWINLPITGEHLYARWVTSGTGGAVKPSDLDAINSPIDNYVAKKVAGSDEFERVEGTNIKKVVDVGRTGPSNQLVVVDADCTVDSVIMGWTIKSGTQIGFRQFTVEAGQFTIDSTDDESGLTFNYVIYK